MGGSIGHEYLPLYGKGTDFNFECLIHLTIFLFAANRTVQTCYLATLNSTGSTSLNFTCKTMAFISFGSLIFSLVSEAKAEALILLGTDVPYGDLNCLGPNSGRSISSLGG